jgi:hypothetical protein
LFAFTAAQQMALNLSRLSLRQLAIDQRGDFFSEIATHDLAPLDSTFRVQAFLACYFDELQPKGCFYN